MYRSQPIGSLKLKCSVALLDTREKALGIGLLALNGRQRYGTERWRVGITTLRAYPPKCIRTSESLFRRVTV
jgi:hypothetical protein